MKKISSFILGLLFSVLLFAQTETKQLATVEKVLNVPIFMYSYPTANFAEVATLTATLSSISDALSSSNEQSSVNDKVKEIVNKAKRKQSKGDVGNFDAIIVNPDDYSGILIKFTDVVSLKSEVQKVLNVPVFMFSYPDDSFEEVGKYSATVSALLGGSSLSDRTKEIVNKSKNKEAKGKVKPFDAIIINPDDFNGILIKFN